MATLALALAAGLVPFAERAEAQNPPPPVEIDEGPAPVNPLDDALLPAGLDVDSSGKFVERLQPNGSSGFLPFEQRSSG